MDLDKLKKDLDNRPDQCEMCGSQMLFKGLGTYECEKCRHRMMDDYGKVRKFLETHPGASLLHVSDETGVTKHKIRELLKDGRIQLSSQSHGALRCEMCNCVISSGRRCTKCELVAHQRAEKLMKEQRTSPQITGTYVKENDLESGAKRFTRES